MENGTTAQWSPSQKVSRLASKTDNLGYHFLSRQKAVTITCQLEWSEGSFFKQVLYAADGFGRWGARHDAVQIGGAGTEEVPPLNGVVEGFLSLDLLLEEGQR